MTQQSSMERMVADWMAEEAADVAPDELINQALMATAPSRQLPRWMAVLKEPSMTAQARQVVGVPRRQLMLAAVLGLLVAAAVVGAGAYLLLRHTPAADSWPGFRGDAARSGAAATGPVGNPVLAWRFHAAGGFHGDLAIAGDLVLGVSDDGVLHALAITDGVERWTHPIANTVRGPFVVDGRVYVAGGDGIVHALNLTDGSTYWSTSAGYLGPSDLSLLDGHLYVGTTDGLVAAIDAASGR
jgi:hypothetical protein